MLEYLSRNELKDERNNLRIRKMTENYDCCLVIFMEVGMKVRIVKIRSKVSNVFR